FRDNPCYHERGERARDLLFRRCEKQIPRFARDDNWVSLVSCPMIEFTNVSKTYRSLLGKTVNAVDDVSLTIREGEVLGLAGPNGAGKSTLIALVLGYMSPSAGELLIDDMAPRRYVESHGI